MLWAFTRRDAPFIVNQLTESDPVLCKNLFRRHMVAYMDYYKYENGQTNETRKPSLEVAPTTLATF